MAINPEINLYCDSEDINTINNSVSLDNILEGDVGINYEPIVIEFSDTINEGIYSCGLDFLSNEDSYIFYRKSFELEFEVEEMGIIFGDVNQDTTVDVLDAIICLGIILDNIIPNEYEQIACDINLDGEINVQDVIYMVNLILD